jgi:hypothetical protein
MGTRRLHQRQGDEQEDFGREKIGASMLAAQAIVAAVSGERIPDMLYRRLKRQWGFQAAREIARNANL